MTTVSQWLAAAGDLPRLDCEILLYHQLGLSRAALITHPSRHIPPRQLQQLEHQLEALRRGVPTAYVVAEQEFWGLTLAVNQDVLIPRPETELLVELALERAPRAARVLDLGTGSGAIAIALAHTRPDLQVTAVDQSLSALAVARQNAATHNAVVNFVASDWFSAVKPRAWDMIISNPPYVADGDPHLPALCYEPQTALVSGPQGLCALQHIAGQAPGYLSPSGWLLLEHGYDQAARVAELLHKAGFANPTCRPDLAGIPRVSLAQWFED